MNRGDALGGVEGAVLDLVAQELLAGVDHGVLAGVDDRIVAVDGLLEGGGVELDLLGQVGDGVGLEAVAGGHEVGNLVETVVGDVGGVDDEPHLVVGLLKDSVGDLVAAAVLGGEALGLVVHHDVVLNAQPVAHEGGHAAVLGVAERVDLHELHILEAGADLLGHGDGVAGGAHVAGGRHGLGHAGVVLHGELGVAGIAAGGHDDGLCGDGDGVAGRDAGARDARDVAVGVGGDGLNLGVGVVLHAQASGAVHEAADVVGAALLAHLLNLDGVAALPLAADCREDLVVEDQAVGLHPVDAVEGVVGQDMHELGVGLLVAALVGVLKELVGAVLDAHGVLALGVGGVEGALAAVGVAAVDVHLVEQDDLGTGLSSGDSSGHASAARTHDHDVALLLDGGCGLKAALGVLEGVNVGAGLLVGVGQSGLEAEGGEGGAGHGVEVERLGLKGALRQDLDGGVADVLGLVGAGDDGGELAVLERGLKIDVAVAAGAGGGVGAVGDGGSGLICLSKLDAAHGCDGGEAGGAGDELTTGGSGGEHVDPFRH